ncbi:hypothetical protein Ccrd_015059 [Cynara cardunculus var. scolymus]|uniref:Uncharacterized protein n=1 Tax=Cynara cardunculus var. scolymus TaxID=59895 RepID=A0A103YCI4_CYNCS|nr:hypothetical protein Ccrd_015059 [Cynara cardunculus var. scolymus]
MCLRNINVIMGLDLHTSLATYVFPETDHNATTRTRVGGLLSVSYHSCSDKDPQLSKRPPTTRIRKSTNATTESPSVNPSTFACFEDLPFPLSTRESTRECDRRVCRTMKALRDGGFGVASIGCTYALNICVLKFIFKN